MMTNDHLKYILQKKGRYITIYIIYYTIVFQNYNNLMHDIKFKLKTLYNSSYDSATYFVAILESFEVIFVATATAVIEWFTTPKISIVIITHDVNVTRSIILVHSTDFWKNND